MSPNCLGKQTGSFPLKVNENLRRANLIKVGETPAWGKATLCSQTQGELAVLAGAQRHLRDLFNPFTTCTEKDDGGHGADQIGFPMGKPQAVLVRSCSKLHWGARECHKDFCATVVTVWLNKTRTFPHIQGRLC